ncbi:type-2 angiotensin II receptor-like [Scleropages formosus]|uniref:Angiotensin II receptor type 2 n=1 Tax=Scleropages formosus TaxID=113540 RepID=A0A0P7YGT3_SCLFO|nr:type-2 angiotensin II receptor-like [Scleropages formosus]KPP66151.1 type-2 angiotensin II receptor-like [Scleropages formosus]
MVMMAALLPANFSTVNVSVNITSNASVNSTTNASCHNILLSEHQNKVIPTIYSIIFALGFVGNGLVVFVLCQKTSRKTVANTYMLSLAVSDLLFLLSLPFWAVYYSFDYDWVFGLLMCKLCGSLLSLNLYASIFFITCMSVDRYLAIVHPFRWQYCQSPRRAVVVSSLVWTTACFATLPTMVFRDTHYLKELGVTACVMHYPTPTWFSTIALMKCVLGFLLPFTIIACCYCAIVCRLLEGPRLNKSSDNLDHVLRMVVAVVVAFFICWFPFHILTFLDALSSLEVLRICWMKQRVTVLLPFALCLGFSNSAINPFLYCFVGNHFRQQLSGLYQAQMYSLSQKRGSISTRLSSFSRKLSDLKDLGQMETVEQHSTP